MMLATAGGRYIDGWRQANGVGHDHQLPARSTSGDPKLALMLYSDAFGMVY